MLFVDLEGLKLHKGFKYETINISLKDITGGSIKSIQEAFLDAFNRALNVIPGIDFCIETELEGEGQATEEEANLFLSTAVIYATAFFKFITTEDSRKREHRLDVPENLKCLKVSMSALKKIINYKTIVNNFNLVLKYKDLVYVLCDEKDVPEKEDFIHDENGDVIHDA